MSLGWKRSPPPLGPGVVGGASSGAGSISSSALGHLTTPLLPQLAHPRPLSSSSNRLCCVSRSSPAAPTAPFTQVSPTLSLFPSFAHPPSAFSSFLVNFAAFEQPDCLTKIELFTFKPVHGCTSLAKEEFAKRTKAAFALQCSGYSGIQVSRCIQSSRFNKWGFWAKVVIFIQILSFEGQTNG